MQQRHPFSLRRALALAICALLPGLPVAQEEQAAAENAAASMTSRMLEQLASLYADAAALIGDNPAQAVGWAEQDIENLGDWEYRIVELEERDDAALETQLNALGNERWEIYWVVPDNDGTRFFLKRPALSYLSRVPLSTLLRMLGGGAQPN